MADDAILRIKLEDAPLTGPGAWPNYGMLPAGVNNVQQWASGVAPRLAAPIPAPPLAQQAAQMRSLLMSMPGIGNSLAMPVARPVKEGEAAEKKEHGELVAASNKQAFAQMAKQLGEHAPGCAAGMKSDAGPGLTAVSYGAQMLKDHADKLGAAGKAVQVAFGALEVVTNTLVASQEQSIKNLKHFGAVASDIARGDFIGAKKQQLQKEIAEKEAIPIFGKLMVWFEGQKKKLAGLEEFTRIKTNVLSEGHRLGSINPHIAIANAQADMIKMRSDMLTGQLAGATYANVARSSAIYEAAMNKALIPMKRMINVKLDNINRRGVPNEEMYELIEAAKNSTKLLEYVKSNTRLSAKFQQEMRDEIKRLREEMENTDFGEDILRKLMDANKIFPDSPMEDVEDPIGWAKQAMIRPLG